MQLVCRSSMSGPARPDATSARTRPADGPAGSHPREHGDVPLRPDARAQQDRGRVDGAGAQHDVLGVDLDPVAVDAHPHAASPPRLDQHPVHRRARR